MPHLSPGDRLWWLPARCDGPPHDSVRQAELPCLQPRGWAPSGEVLRGTEALRPHRTAVAPGVLWLCIFLLRLSRGAVLRNQGLHRILQHAVGAASARHCDARRAQVRGRCAVHGRVHAQRAEPDRVHAHGRVSLRAAALLPPAVHSHCRRLEALPVLLCVDPGGRRVQRGWAGLQPRQGRAAAVERSEQRRHHQAGDGAVVQRGGWAVGRGCWRLSHRLACVRAGDRQLEHQHVTVAPALCLPAPCTRGFEAHICRHHGNVLDVRLLARLLPRLLPHVRVVRLPHAHCEGSAPPPAPARGQRGRDTQVGQAAL
eukprot:Opistho-1_new@24582